LTGPADTKGAAPAARPLFDAGFCEPGRRKLILVAAILASSMGFIDGTVTAIAMPDIRAALGASLADAQWIHNAYMVTISALILAGGALGDKLAWRGRSRWASGCSWRCRRSARWPPRPRP